MYSAVECLYKLIVLQKAFALATPHKALDIIVANLTQIRDCGATT